MTNLICLFIGHDIKTLEKGGLLGALTGQSIYCSRCGYMKSKQKSDQDKKINTKESDLCDMCGKPASKGGHNERIHQPIVKIDTSLRSRS